MTAKKTAELPAVKKVVEKTPAKEFPKPKKDMASRRSKVAEIADNSFLEETDAPPVKDEEKETPVLKTATASLPPAAKRPPTTKSTVKTATPAKGGKLELDEVLSGLAKKPEPKGPAVDFRQYYK